MRRRRTLALAAVAIGLSLAATLGIAQATPPNLQTTDLLAKGTTVNPLALDARGTLPNGKARPWHGTYNSPWDVTALRVTLPPGASTGWHRHPGPAS